MNARPRGRVSSFSGRGTSGGASRTRRWMTQVLFLTAASGFAVVPWPRMPAWVGPLVLACVALATQVVPFGVARDTARYMGGAIAFLLLAVPLAVALDETGFFAALATMADRGRHLRAGLWVLAAAVTIVFNLDAAVVLLTPLYVRIAVRRGDDPILYAFMPALLASLASSLLPVSNLTNLIAAERLHLSATAFVAHLAIPTLAAIVVGGWVFSVRGRSTEPRTTPGSASLTPADREALRIGLPVVVWLLVGFTIGERLGLAAWMAAAIALVWLCLSRRAAPWRSIPYGAAFLAIGLGVLATSASAHLPIARLLSVGGAPGERARIGAFALGANAVNTLPAVLLALPPLQAHPDRVWAVLLGVNIGPTLWITGALSTLLWQATMARLGHPVSARRYVRTAALVGGAALVAAAWVHVALVSLRA